MGHETRRTSTPDPSSRPRPREAIDHPLRRLAVAIAPLTAFVAVGVVVDLAADLAADLATVRAPASVEAVASNAKSIIPLQDQRNLLDLARGTEASLDPASARAPVQATPTNRGLDYTIGAVQDIGLGLRADDALARGGYARVSGVPATAVLTKGLAIAPSIWLVDAAELPIVALRLRAGTTEAFVLAIQMIAPDGRVIAAEKIDFRPIPATPAVPTAPADTPPVQEESEAGKHLNAIAGSDAPKPSDAGLLVAIDRELKLVRGQPARVAIVIEPRAAVPEGAYVVLRGVPAEAKLSAGTRIAAEVWFLSLTDAEMLTLQLPAKVPPRASLGARLVSFEGRLLAEDKVDLADPYGPAETAPPLASVLHGITQSPRVAAPTGKATLPSPGVTAPAASTSPTVSSPEASPPVVLKERRTRKGRGAPNRAEVPAAITPLTAGQAASTAGKTGAAAQAAAAAAVKADPTLIRGRKMLDMGYIVVARPLLERAAADGSVEAAALLGASFDAGWLARKRVVGIGPDAAMARKWFEEARRLGGGAAEQVITQLSK